MPLVGARADDAPIRPAQRHALGTRGPVFIAASGLAPGERFRAILAVTEEATRAAFRIRVETEIDLDVAVREADGRAIAAASAPGHVATDLDLVPGGPARELTLELASAAAEASTVRVTISQR